MYGTTYGTLKKTTIYIPEDLKKKLEAMAKEKKTSEANIIRDAVSAIVEKRVYPKPRLPLPGMTLGDPTIAERAGDLLDGFGE